MAKILIIDDDPGMTTLFSDMASDLGHEAHFASTLREGLNMAAGDIFDVVYLDVNLPDGNGLDGLPVIKKIPHSPEVVILTDFGDAKGAEYAISSGAWDYVEKSASRQTMVLPLIRALQYREAKESSRRPMPLKRERIIGESAAIHQCLDLVAQAASTEVDVLISGQTGTGKELFAAAIHENSRRAEEPFVVVDCASLPETLVESLLFGHEKGAFTGADSNRVGLIGQAHGGTLFLDEVGELPPSVQKRFLRVLQERRFRPLGTRRETESDFRLIAATNRNLEKMVDQKTFRQDLLYRLDSLTIDLPPLKERREDIKDLAIYQISKLCDRYRMEIKGFSPEFFEALQIWEWPGNVRELFNTLESALTVAQADPTLYPRHLPRHIRIRIAKDLIHQNGQKPPASPKSPEPSLDNWPTLQKHREDSLATLEKTYLVGILKAAQGDITTVCRISGLSKSRLYTLLRIYNIPTPTRNRRAW